MRDTSTTFLSRTECFWSILRSLLKIAMTQDWWWSKSLRHLSLSTKTCLHKSRALILLFFFKRMSSKWSQESNRDQDQARQTVFAMFIFSSYKANTRVFSASLKAITKSSLLLSTQISWIIIRFMRPYYNN